MLQPYVCSKNHSNHRKFRKGDQKRKAQDKQNLSALAEGEGVTATSLGFLANDYKAKKIHRVPSVEGATATSLGNLSIVRKCKKINRKNAPDRVSPCSNNTNKGGSSMERTSMLPILLTKGKNILFLLKVKRFLLLKN